MNSFPGTGRDAAPVVGLGITGREQDNDLRLQRVRVLELINEKVGEAFLEMLAHAGGLDEQIAGADEQVKEIEFSGTLFQQLVLDNSLSEFGLQEGGEIRSGVSRTKASMAASSSPCKRRMSSRLTCWLYWAFPFRDREIVRTARR